MNLEYHIYAGCHIVCGHAGYRLHAKRKIQGKFLDWLAEVAGKESRDSEFEWLWLYTDLWLVPNWKGEEETTEYRGKLFCVFSFENDQSEYLQASFVF